MKFRELILVALTSLTIGCGKDMTVEPTAGWPDLELIAHVSGRVATTKDMDSGAAAFVIPVDSIPIDMVIPQYAYHIDEEDGLKYPCVVIQAEIALDEKLV